MPDWLRIALAIAAGLSLLAGLSWFAFGGLPRRRSDGGLTQHDAAHYHNSNDHRD
jgi:hypothetical protein